MPFLDQIEERQPLVAVVLRDRDDQPQVGLDHRLLCVRIAALDALRELDLLCGGQQRVASGVAEEQLQRVRRRLLDDRLRRRWRRRRLLFAVLVLQNLDAALLELSVDRIRLERVEPQRLENLDEIRVPKRPILLGRLEQLVQLGGRQDVVDFNRSHPD